MEKLFSAHIQKASLIALDLMRFADTIVNERKRGVLGGLAAHLSARISVMDSVSAQAEKRRLHLATLAAHLLQQISQSQNPTD